MNTRQIVGKMLPKRGYSDCKRCHSPWWWAEDHITNYDSNRGCFPLCEDCWGDLSILGRIPYYIELIEIWDRDSRVDDEKAKSIIEAVLAGE